MGINSELEARCDTLASRYYRRRTTYCEAYGKSPINCWGGLEWAHIVSRRNRRLRYEPFNHLILCQGHHHFWTDHPMEWERFVRHDFPERWREVEAHRNEYQKLDYEAWLAVFTESKEPV